MGRKLIDISGRRCGRLMVVEALVQRANNGAVLWKCVCDCGQETISPGHCLRRGQIKSCGCLKREVGAAQLKLYALTGARPQYKHGEAIAGKETVEWRTWHSIKSRCDPARPSPNPDYAARGIRVCHEWLDSYERFLSDVGRRPSPEHSLDRIDVNGNYAPGNVRWATAKEQARNRRNSLFIEFDGLRLTLAEWAERTGLTNTTIRNRLRAGWSASRALRTEVKRRK